MSFKNPDHRFEFFHQIGQAKNKEYLWECGNGDCDEGDTVSSCKIVRHLWYHHKDLFYALNDEGYFDPVKHKEEDEEKPQPKDILKQRYACEFCGQKYTNQTLGEHRGRQSNLSSFFGCTKRDEFYSNGGKCVELVNAEEERKNGKEQFEQNVSNALDEARKKLAAAIGDQSVEGAVYIRVNKEWLEKGKSEEAEQNWVYTGSAKDLEDRAQKHNDIGNRFAQHFCVNVGDLDQFKDDASVPIVVVSAIPLILAQQLEQATILLTNNMRRNITVPFRREIGLTHSELRQLAARLLLRAFDARLKIGLEPEKKKKRRRPMSLELPTDESTSSSNVPTPSLSASLPPTPITPLERMQLEMTEAMDKQIADDRNKAAGVVNMASPKAQFYARQAKMAALPNLPKKFHFHSPIFDFPTCNRGPL